MCYMYVGFRRVMPETDSGMDLAKPYENALSMFNMGM
jgi:hypothetical protein